MKEYDDICYKANFVNQVILRIDFLRYVTQDVVFSDVLENYIVKYYPKKGKDQIIRFNAINLVFDTNDNGIPSANGQIMDGIQKEYSSSNGNKVIVSNMFLAFEINNYTVFEEHMKSFRDILYALFANGKVIAKRSGLRYINIFDASKVKLQKKYFNSNISASLITKPIEIIDGLKMVRSMHTNEYRTDTAILNFRYGMYNPAYPNALLNNSFALDYDCYTEEAIENADYIYRFIESAHDMIQSLFEDSITDSLRRIMQNE